MLLIIDNYDSFTYNLVDYFQQLGVEPQLLKNDECTLDQIVEMNPKGIVLSPGPGRPAEAGMNAFDLVLAIQEYRGWIGNDLIQKPQDLGSVRFVGSTDQ